MRRIRHIMMAILMLVLFFTLVACGMDSDDEPIIKMRFYDNDEIIGEQIFDIADFVIPISPAKEGMHFEGWYFDRDFQCPFDITTASDHRDTQGIIAVFARYTPFEHKAPRVTITFYANDNVYERISMDKGGSFALPVDPNLAHHDFVGWYKDAALTERYDHLNELGKGIEKDTDLYARFDEKTATITLVANGKKCNTLTTKMSERVSLPDAPYSENKTFLYWAEEGKSEAYDLDTYYATEDVADITLNAIYVNNSVAVTLMDGANILSIIHVARNESLNLSPLARTLTHEFECWTQNDEIFDLDAFNKETFRENITLNAKWTERVNHVNYYNGDTLVAKIEVNSTLVLNQPDTPVKNGYIFTRWYTVDNATRTTFDSDAYLSDIERSDISVYAEFAIIRANVTFYNGEECVETATIYGNKIIENIKTPVRANADFVRWECEGKIFDIAKFNTMLRSDSSATYGDIRVDAVFKARVVRVQYIHASDEIGYFDFSDEIIFAHPTNLRIPEGMKIEGYYKDENYLTPFNIDEYVQDQNRTKVSIFVKCIPV